MAPSFFGENAAHPKAHVADDREDDTKGGGSVGSQGGEGGAGNDRDEHVALADGGGGQAGEEERHEKEGDSWFRSAENHHQGHMYGTLRNTAGGESRMDPAWQRF